jgi:hypothetical protein
MSVIENNNRDEYIVHFGDSEYEVFSNVVCDLEGCEKYISNLMKDGYDVSNFTIFKEVPFKIQIKLEIGE